MRVLRPHLLFLALILSTGGNAQEIYLSLAGTLVDGQSRDPIPYASIYVKGKAIGTTTNDEGKFLFHVPSAFQQDTLIISVIGYNPFRSVRRGLRNPHEHEQEC